MRDIFLFFSARLKILWPFLFSLGRNKKEPSHSSTLQVVSTLLCVCVCLLSLVKYTSKNTLRRCFFILLLAGAFGMFKLVKQNKNVYKGPGGRSIVDPIKSALLSPCCCCTHTKSLYPISIVYSKLSSLGCATTFRRPPSVFFGWWNS